MMFNDTALTKLPIFFLCFSFFYNNSFHTSIYRDEFRANLFDVHQKKNEKKKKNSNQIPILNGRRSFCLHMEFTCKLNGTMSTKYEKEKKLTLKYK